MKKTCLLAIVILGLGMGCWPATDRRQTFSGSLEMTEHMVGARVPGRVVSISVKEGDQVRKGQLLATLDRFTQAQHDYERTLRLQKQGGLSEQTLELAELTWEDQKIISPVDGVVLVKIKEVGEVLAAGSPVFDIGDRSELWVRIYVPEGLINRVRLDQPATVRLDGLKQDFKGHVSFVAVKAEFTPRNVQTSEERVTQTFAVKILLHEPPAHLRPGVSADVTLDLNDQ